MCFSVPGKGLPNLSFSICKEAGLDHVTLSLTSFDAKYDFSMQWYELFKSHMVKGGLQMEFISLETHFLSLKPLGE